MLLWPLLTSTQLSSVAPHSWVLPSGHTPGNRYERRAKPGEGLRCCVFLHTCSLHSSLLSSLSILSQPSIPSYLSLPSSAHGRKKDAYRDERPGIHRTYRMDGQLLNQRWMHSHSRVSAATIHELLFADDCTLTETTEEGMQRSMDLFAATCDNMGLRINTEKTVVMHQPPPNRQFDQ
ncbi:unnamed protein product [Schistocephalus solidus]|uniref:Reverse transcriptase domain-containing protein n=1 Tax=Schistocephalus solidus TaxID=70667 RepID=A0A183T138_SCHSO|nr:unnamed protein product [Schistocephalus solidus]